jgi:hypothetical protein
MRESPYLVSLFEFVGSSLEFERSWVCWESSTSDGVGFRSKDEDDGNLEFTRAFTPIRQRRPFGSTWLEAQARRTTLSSYTSEESRRSGYGYYVWPC